MLSRLVFLPLFPLVALLGCSVSGSQPSGPSPTSQATNWQIQAGANLTSPPNTYPNFVGAIQIQGTQATAVFSSSAGSSATPQILSYSGSFNTSTNTLALYTVGYSITLAEPAAPNTATPVAVNGGCVYPPSYTGPECLAIVAAPSVGVEIAPLAGTYTGTLTDPTKPSMVGIGTGTLTLTQSPTPNTNGQFPLTGTFGFTSDIALPGSTVNGTIGGEGILLANSSTGTGPTISLTASTNPTATQITVSNLTWAQAGVTYTFTGTLTHQ